MKPKLARLLLVSATLAIFTAALVLLAAPESSAAARITTHQLQTMIEDGEKITIIDVRTPAEYLEGHIPGSISVPLSTIKDLETADYEGKVVLYCTVGVRSSKARKLFAKKGVNDLVDLKGGIRVWESLGGEIITNAKGVYGLDDNAKEEVYSKYPTTITVPKGVCEIDIPPAQVIGKGDK